MNEKLEIYIENFNKKFEIPLGLSLIEISKKFNVKLKFPILGAFVNNELEELRYRIFKPKNIRFIDITYVDGMRMYVRSLLFILYKAIHDLYPDKVLKIEHAVSKGLYCEFADQSEAITFEMIFDIVKRMREIVKEDVAFVRKEILLEDAVKIFEKNNYSEKAKLFKTRKKLYTTIYSLDGVCDYFYGHLVPSSGYIQTFDLAKYYDGMLLMLPKSDKPNEVQEIILQPKLFEIFQEYNEWGAILGLDTIGSINEAVLKGKTREMIQIGEALHEKKVAQIADIIYKHKKQIKLILISGPSSSGKTTFSKRLSIQLKVLGLQPVPISLDNYFVNRENTPLDENGEYDFETIEEIDISFLNKQLLSLFKGEEIDLPKFSFEEGKRFFNGTKLQLHGNEILILEGIHALNPKLTPIIETENKFKIYVSALTQVGIDWRNRIPTTDNRLLRRIIRDYKYRGYSALDTLKRWKSVRKGEEKNIFPYQEEADIMFNSALMFELGILKKFALPLLHDIFENEPEYAEAKRLIKFLSYFVTIDHSEVPPTSILREFLGGSSFSYK